MIRASAFDSFETMLVRSTRHPGMLLYLDQAQSTGPGSAAAGGAVRRPNVRPPGLNENLAREIMELHTVGLGANYSQADVTEFAKALTGWTVGGPRDGPDLAGRFVYRAVSHEPGERSILGKSYGPVDEDQARQVLHDLAHHAATAQHIARKLAIHFVADDPSPVLVDKLARSFSATGGDLAALAATLIDADEAWAVRPEKFKTPYEFVVSCWRAAGDAPSTAPQLLQPTRAMGQDQFRAPSPKGWDDVAGAWATPANIIQRLTWSEDFAGQLSGRPDVEPAAVARACLGARLGRDTAAALASAESRKEALTLLFMSPEFQRR